MSTMPHDDEVSSDAAREAPVARPGRQTARSWFSVPPWLRRIFDQYPLVTYPANELPMRASRSREQHTLWIFATEAGALNVAPSFNPSCLKWQAYLKFCGIPFRTVASSNHASPSGALPFLLPASKSQEATQQTSPIPSNKLQKWVVEQGAAGAEPSDMRYEAYMSLLDHRIRRAWLHTLYLTSSFQTVALPLYIESASTSSIVRFTNAYELQSAARAELLKHSPVLDEGTLYNEAVEAYGALDQLLGEKEWFFGAENPGLFDASVFAYTHLLLDRDLGEGWEDNRLSTALREKEKLVRHRERVLKLYF